VYLKTLSKYCFDKMGATFYFKVD